MILLKSSIIPPAACGTFTERTLPHRRSFDRNRLEAWSLRKEATTQTRRRRRSSRVLTR